MSHYTFSTRDTKRERETENKEDSEPESRKRAVVNASPHLLSTRNTKRERERDREQGGFRTRE
jgi:hypothetical protein